MGKKALIAQIERRLAAIERERARENHQHVWLYSRNELHAGAALVTWSWECVSSDCPKPKSSTNSWSMVPDHFPRHLGPTVQHPEGAAFDDITVRTADGKRYSPETHWPDGYPKR